MSVDIWTEYESDQALTIEEARRRIADELDWPLEKVRVEHVSVSVRQLESAAGLLLDYRTTWTFQAVVKR